ncbi:MAG: DUF1735 domain-containing protein [Chitinophagaceae bacterium]|nr:DUF1735 domain-containing protein [Chitinophagaceae bacterium]
MKYLKFIKQFAALIIAISLLNACDKIDTPEPLGGSGQTTVKILDGGPSGDAPQIKSIAIDFVSSPQTLGFIDVRRDVPNGSELSKTMTVTLKDDTTQLRVYNDTLIAHGENPLVYLPSNLYTVSANNPKVGGDGGNYTVTLKPGESAKELVLTVPNSTLLDPSSQYGLAFTITSADANGKVSANSTVIVQLGAKNTYDGKYEVTGSLVDIVVPTITQYMPKWEAHLVTTGANTNDVYDMTYTGDVFHPIFSNGAPSYYGAFGMSVTFNPNTNVVSNMVSPYEPAANTRSAVLDGDFVSTFDPVTHNIRIKYFMKQPSVVPAPPNIRVIFDETWTYIGPR